jgi:hypothetical protein
MPEFKAKITKMGRKRVVNVPANNKNFSIGETVVVAKD